MDDKITITVSRDVLQRISDRHSNAVDEYRYNANIEAYGLAFYDQTCLKNAIAEADAKFQCKRCLKITSMSEQCYDESADIIVCSACSRELTRLDEGLGRYVAHKEVEKEKP